MIIREATKRDLSAINAIYNQAVRQRFCTAHLEELDMAYTESWFLDHPAHRYPVFISEDEKKVTGWVSLGPYRADRQALAHVGEVSYYVSEDCWGKGIGSLLLQHAINMAPDCGLSILVAILLNKNPGSIALLEKFGFSQWGSMPGIASIDGEQADHLYYGLKL